MTLKIRNFTFGMVCVAVLTSVLAIGQAAEVKKFSEEKQRKLISVLQSDSPVSEKAITCKQLAIYGNKDAVPALASLLPDANLSSWSRIALEAIPDPSADEALCAAMSKVQGRLLIGVINSISYRHSAQAVSGLVEKLKDANVEVVSAAAEALGHIGGDVAARALEQSLANAPEGALAAVAEGGILCAEKYLAEGQTIKAVKLYDLIRQANVPQQRVLEAIRGAILARKTSGIPLLVEQLRASDKALFSIGIATSRELAGREVTAAIASELNRAIPERQTALLLALADRSDATALPAILQAAKNGQKKLRLAAFGIMDNLGNATCLPVLLAAAVDTDAEVAKTAKVTLVRMAGKDVDASLLERLPQAEGKMRQVMIELAGQRHIEGALPVIVKYTEDPDAGVRGAAVEAIGNIGEEKQAADLVKLLQKTENAKDRTNIEKALLAICGRVGANCVKHLLPLAQSSSSDLRKVALRTLASVGGSEALAAIKSAINDQDETVQDEAVSTLSTWPDNWPDDAGVAEPLMALAKSGKKMAHQVLGLRGYLQLVQGDKKLKDEQKAVMVKDLLPLIKRPEEKRMAITVIGSIPTASMLECLQEFSADQAVAEESGMAIINLAGKNIPGVSLEQRQKAIQTVIDKTKNDATRRRAERALRTLK